MYNHQSKTPDTSNMNEEKLKEFVDTFKSVVEKLPNTVARTSHVQMPMLNWEGNNPQKEFQIWRDCLQSSFVINGTPKEVQWHYIFLSSGKRGQEVFKTWDLDDATKRDPEKVLAYFDKHMCGTVNKWVARLALSSVEQQTNESIAEFVARIRELVRDCDYKEESVDENIVYNLIKGVRWENLRRKLIDFGNDLVSSKAVDTALQYEATLRSSSKFGAEKSINFTRRMQPVCSRCNRNHERGSCPAYKQKCRACGAMGHFASSTMCRTPQQTATSSRGRVGTSASGHQHQRRRDVHETVAEGGRGHPDQEFIADRADDAADAYTDQDLIKRCGTVRVNNIDSVKSDTRLLSQLICTVKLRKSQASEIFDCSMKCDTGANCNLLPMRVLRCLFPNYTDSQIVKQLKPSTDKLKAVNGSDVKFLGKFTAQCKFRDSKWILSDFYVCETTGPVIFGCLDSIKLKLIVVPETRLISNYSEWVAADDKILFNAKVDRQDTNPDVDSRVLNVSQGVDVGPRNEAKVKFNVSGNNDTKPVLQYSSTVSDVYSDECLCSDVLNLDSADRGAECRQLRVDNVESVRNLKRKKSIMSEHSRGKFEFNVNKFTAPAHGVNDLTEMYPHNDGLMGNRSDRSSRNDIVNPDFDDHDMECRLLQVGSVECTHPDDRPVENCCSEYLCGNEYICDNVSHLENMSHPDDGSTENCSDEYIRSDVSNPDEYMCDDEYVCDNELHPASLLHPDDGLFENCFDKFICGDMPDLDSGDRGVECRQSQVDTPTNVSRDVKHRGYVKSEHSLGKFNFNANKLNVPIHSVNDLADMYPKCFHGTGNLHGEYHIELRADAQSHVAAPCRYPTHLKTEICKKLEKMEDLGIITKCDDESASDWVNQLALTRKRNGDLRLCLDSRHLNRAIRRTPHSAMTVNEITHRLRGATMFSKFNAKHGFWSIKLDEESSELCTFQSPVGNYKFARLPFGLRVSQDTFQKHMDDILRRVDLGDEAGAIRIANDLVVYGRDRKSHDRAIHMLIQSAEYNGLAFRRENCAIRQPEVSFFGLSWNETGVKPDQRKGGSCRSNCTGRHNDRRYRRRWGKRADARRVQDTLYRSSCREGRGEVTCTDSQDAQQHVFPDREYILYPVECEMRPLLPPHIDPDSPPYEDDPRVRRYQKNSEISRHLRRLQHQPERDTTLDTEETCSYTRHTARDTTARHNRKLIGDLPSSMDMDEMIRSNTRECARLIELNQDLCSLKSYSSTSDQPAAVLANITHSDIQTPDSQYSSHSRYGNEQTNTTMPTLIW